MRCFVTGATGFIGRHLAARLVGEGHQVRAAVRARARSAPDPVEELRTAGVEVLNGDLLDVAFIEQALQGCQAVFHLAWQSNRPSVREVSGGDQAERWRANVDGARLLTELSKKAGIERFLYTSTIAVYGAAGGGEGRAAVREEDAGHFQGVAAGYREYGESKLTIERMIAELMPPPDYAILRPSVVYGVGAPFAVPLVRSALFGPRARQFVQTLQWIHVEDVATALITCATTNRPLNKTFNIAGDETVSSDSLHEAIRQVAGMPQQPPMYGQNSAGFGQLPPKYDVTKARAAFDFRSAVPLAQGLPDMVRTALPEAMTAPSSMPGFGAWPDRTHQAGWGPGTRPGFGGFQGSGWWRR